MELLIIFTALSMVNVVFSTIRSIVTIKGGKWSASLISAAYFAFYNIMLIYTVATFPLWQKCAITFGCNLVGVLIVKMAEEKMHKDMLWKVELTVHSEYTAELHRLLNSYDIPHNYLENVGKWSIFNAYCATQKESAIVKTCGKACNAKFFVSETKIL